MSAHEQEATSGRTAPYDTVPTINFFLYPPIEPVAGGTRSLAGDLGLDCRTPEGTVFVLYVSIPYCRSRCNSCCCFRGLLPEGDSQHAFLEEYVDCLVAQARAYGAAPRFAGGRCGAIYIGGGTGSVLSPTQVDRLVRALRAAFPAGDDLEINLEGNPVDFLPEYLQAVRRAGITRLSIGYQSAQRDVLEALHTSHGSAAALAAARHALATGFDRVNIDLLYNVPGQTEQQWRDDLDTVIAMGPTSISVGDYMVFPGTRAERLVRAGRLAPQHSVDEAYRWYQWSCELLARHGYYEQVRGIFCRPGYEQDYVRLCGNESCEIVALGAGAFGFINRYQFRTTSDSETYQAQVRRGSFFEVDSVSIQASPRNLMERYIIHNLYSEVVDRQKFSGRFGVDPLEAFPEVFAKLERFDLVSRDGRQIRLTEMGKKWRKNVYQEFHSCQTGR
jgi:oxygen-independent coproporphyrinogen III oxidase